MILVIRVLIFLVLLLLNNFVTTSKVSTTTNNVVKTQQRGKPLIHHPFKYKPDYKDWLGLKGRERNFDFLLVRVGK